MDNYPIGTMSIPYKHVKINRCNLYSVSINSSWSLFAHLFPNASSGAGQLFCVIQADFLTATLVYGRVRACSIMRNALITFVI